MKNTKYNLYYTFNKNLDFELTLENEKETVEKINSMTPENMEIIFHLIFEYLRNKHNLFDSDIDTQNEIMLNFLDKDKENYKMNFSNFDNDLKKILWKFLNPNYIPKK